MDSLEVITYNIVKELQYRRMAEHREPVNVSLLDIQRAVNEKVKAILNGYVENYTMSWFSSLNGIPMFKIEKPLK